MLHILLLLLKIIGIVLLVILGILLLGLCVTLFVPLRYQGNVSAEGTVESIKVKFKFSWFFHLFSGYLFYEEQKLKWQVRILRQKLRKKLNRGEEAEKTVKKEKAAETKVDTEKAEDIYAESADTRVMNADKQKKKNFIEKIKYTILNFCDKIKLLIKKKEDLETFLQNEIHRSAWTRFRTEVLRLLRFIKPRKLQLNLHFGFEDPSVTGNTLAVLSMLYPFYGDHVRIVPDFENVVFEGDVYIKGKIYGIHAMRLAWSLFFDKNIQTTYKRITNWKR